MLSKAAFLHPQLKGLSRLLAATPKACFSAPADNAAAPETESAMFKFEKEWQKHYEERNSKQLNELDKYLTESQKKRLDLLCEALTEMKKSEVEYFTRVIREKVFATSGINPLKVNMDWPTIKQMDLGSWPPVDPSGKLTEEGIQKLWPAGQANFAELFGGFGVGGGAGAAPQQAAAAEQPKEEAKVEEKVEKLKFDIELAAIDAAKKISIIKEVREITKLGLKEAKEMVEKAPVVLKKDVKKEEAEQLKEKLISIGCTVNLL